VTGPWFFLGVQELMLHLPPLWAGLVLPGAFLALFLFLPLLCRGAACWVRPLLMAGLAAYVLLGLKLYVWGAA
jgi:ubiquinol-cytochrome c reductase cytochrome b subunit